MEYYVLRQSNTPVELYNPNWKQVVERYQWNRMFPYTGDIKDYFSSSKGYALKSRKTTKKEEEQQSKRKTSSSTSAST